MAGIATLLLLGIWLLTLWLYGFSYPAFETAILQVLHKPHIQQAFEQALPPARFALIQQIALACSSLLLLLHTWLVLRTNTYKHASRLLLYAYNFAIQHLQYTLSFQHKKLRYGWYILLTLVIAACTFCMAIYPITIDEAVTYILFSSKGPLFAIGYYPAANNHILYSLLTTAFVHLPLSPVVALRLSLLPGTLLLLLTVTYLVKKQAGEKWVLPALLLLVSTPAFINYSIFARGYIYVMLFVALSLCIASGFTQHTISRKRWIAFILVQVLGCYTVLTYLYCMLPLLGALLLGCLLQKQYKRIIQLVVATILIAIGVIVLFTPVLITTGMQAAIILSKEQLHLNPQQQLLQLYDAVTFNVSANVYMSVLLLAGTLLLTYQYGYQKLLQHSWLLTFVACILFMLVLLLVLHKRSMERNWVHLAVIVPVTSVVFAGSIIKVRTSLAITVSIAICSINLLAFFGQTSFLRFYRFACDNKQTAALLHSHHGKKIFFDEVYIKPMLDFYDQTNGVTNVQYYTNDKDFLYAAPFNEAEGYDFIIQINNDSRITIPPQYRLAQKACNYTVWQLKPMP